jgi:hypothetical protein
MSVQRRIARRVRPDRGAGRLGRVASARAAACGEAPLEALVAPLTPVEVERLQLIELVHASGALQGRALLGVLPGQLVLLALGAAAPPEDASTPEAADEVQDAPAEEAEETVEVPEAAPLEPARLLPSSAVAELQLGRRGGVRVVLALPGEDPEDGAETGEAGRAETGKAERVVVLEARSQRLADVLPRPPRAELPTQPVVRPHADQLDARPARTAPPARTPGARVLSGAVAVHAVVATPLEPCGYVELDGCLKPARWSGARERPPAVGTAVLVAESATGVELSASEPLVEEVA